MNINATKLSQNFLKNQALVSKLVSASGIDKNDIVYDIGAGRGIITKELSKKCKKVISIELDPNLYTYLKEELKNYQNIELLNQDFLRVRLPDYEHKVFSNIPFNITSDIVNRLIFSKNPPKSSHLIIQKEAALRFMGEGEGTMISLLIKPFFDLKVEYEFSKSDFSPAPSVDTVLFSVIKKSETLIDTKNSIEYKNFIIYTLNQQKPTLKLRLNKIFTDNQFYKLSKDLNFKIDITTQDLNLNQWVALFEYYLIGVEPSKKSLTQDAQTSHSWIKSKQEKLSRTKIRL